MDTSSRRVHLWLCCLFFGMKTILGMYFWKKATRMLSMLCRLAVTITFMLVIAMAPVMVAAAAHTTTETWWQFDTLIAESAYRSYQFWHDSNMMAIRYMNVVSFVFVYRCLSSMLPEHFHTHRTLAWQLRLRYYLTGTLQAWQVVCRSYSKTCFRRWTYATLNKSRVHWRGARHFHIYVSGTAVVFWFPRCIWAVSPVTLLSYVRTSTANGDHMHC